MRTQPHATHTPSNPSFQAPSPPSPSPHFPGHFTSLNNLVSKTLCRWWERNGGVGKPRRDNLDSFSLLLLKVVHLFSLFRCWSLSVGFARFSFLSTLNLSLPLSLSNLPCPFSLFPFVKIISRENSIPSLHLHIFSSSSSSPVAESRLKPVLQSLICLLQVNILRERGRKKS